MCQPYSGRDTINKKGGMQQIESVLPPFSFQRLQLIKSCF